MIKIDKINRELLEAYFNISIAFKGHSILELRNDNLDGLAFKEIKVPSFRKDYDDEEDQSQLIDRFDLKNWHIITYRDNDKIVAGAIIAHDTPEINMLEGKKDLAVLWDIRIDEAYRGHGIGSKIIDQVKELSKEIGCNRIKIETQNINVAACRFYMKQGGVLTSFNKHYYNDLPKEIQMIWSIYL